MKNLVLPLVLIFFSASYLSCYGSAQEQTFTISDVGFLIDGEPTYNYTLTSNISGYFKIYGGVLIKL